MSNLPNYTSFQGVLDSIIRSYLLNELPPETGESGIRYQNIAERDLGISQARFLQNLQVPGASGNANPAQQNSNTNNDGQVPGTSASATLFNLQNATSEHDYVRALYQCFEKRGVFKELQTFLRQKLVSILQDEWPDLQNQSPGCKVEENTMVFRLVEDFLKCHRLLYTLSVLVSEADVKQLHSKELYGKLSSKQAEDLLDELGIKRRSRLSGQVLKCYFDQESFSLLESMNYLGVWVDDSIGQHSQQLEDKHDAQNVKSRKKGGRPKSGEAIIFLSRSNEPSEKAMKDATVQCGNTTGSVVGVERRMLEMEKRLEKDKETKVKEAIDRYKNEEQTRLREEMEANFQLLLMEREKEHYSDVQKRMEEVNAEFQRERQKWLDEKVKHEHELVEFQKKLADMAKSGLASDKALFQNVSAGIAMAQPRQAHFNTNDGFPNYVQCACECNCRKKTSPRQQGTKHAGKSNSTTRGENSDSFPTPKPQHDHVQQDQLVFLQYRLEQQDEEIKSLRRQLQLSPLVASAIAKAKSTSVGGGNASRRENRSHEEEEDQRQRASDDNLGDFLKDARTRVGKLDVAVSKVDEIVQELFTKRREATPVSTFISARLQASADQRRLKRSLFTTTNSLYSEIPSVPGALVHQQLPEKQIKFVSPELQQCSVSNFNVYDYYKQRDGDTREIGAGAASTLNQVAAPVVPSTSFALRQKEAVEMATPRDQMFQVAYGMDQRIPQVKSPPKKSDFKESQAQNATRTKQNGHVKTQNITKARHEESGEGESLFHMAAKHLLDNEKVASSKENSQSLEEKAIRHGALSKEKVESQDEYDDGDCRSVSIAESISIGLRKTNNVLRTVNGNGRNSGSNWSNANGNNPTNKVKKKNSEDVNGGSKSARDKGNGRQSKPAYETNLFSPPHSDRKNDSIKQSPRADQEDTDLDNNNDHSDISVPKSEDIQDFWQI